MALTTTRSDGWRCSASPAIPLLIHLGARLDDKVPAVVFQRQRVDSANAWRWPELPVSRRVRPRQRQEGRSDTLALVVNLSGSIGLDELPRRRWLQHDLRAAAGRACPERTGRHREPGRPGSRSRLPARRFLAVVERDHGKPPRVALFAAVPVSAAVTLGRVLMPNVSPAWTVYDRDETRPFLLSTGGAAVKFVDDFESFLRTEVNLNQTRPSTGCRTASNAIENFLAGQATFSPLFLDMIPAGSWATGRSSSRSATNDEFDADMLLYVKENADWRPKDYIEQLYAAFRGSDTYKSKAQEKTRCVRIDYAGDFHVDVVPYLERFGQPLHHQPARSRRTRAASRPLIRRPSPPGLTSDQRASNGSFVKVVRLIKYLRDYKNTFRCKSIILTTLLGNELNR